MENVLPKAKPELLNYLEEDDLETVISEDEMISIFTVALHELIGDGFR